MKKNFLFYVCILFALNSVFIACQDDDDTPQVGVCLKEVVSGNDWRTALRKHAEKNLNKYGLTYSLSQSAGSTQSNDIQAMVNKGSEVLIIVPDGASNEVVADVIAGGVPVIFAESAIGDDYTALIKIDNIDIGRSAGEFFNKQINISKIALFRVTQDDESSSGRIQGVKEILNEGLSTVEIEIAAYTSAAGKTAMQNILNNSDYEDVDAIYAQDDAIANGVLEALDAISSDRIKAIVGCGGSNAFFTKIEEAVTINLATTLYSPAAFMEKSVEVANAVLKGTMPAEKIISLGSDLVDKSNVEEYKKNAPY